MDRVGRVIPSLKYVLLAISCVIQYEMLRCCAIVNVVFGAIMLIVFLHGAKPTLNELRLAITFEKSIRKVVTLVTLVAFAMALVVFAPIVTLTLGLFDE